MRTNNDEYNIANGIQGFYDYNSNEKEKEDFRTLLDHVSNIVDLDRLLADSNSSHVCNS